MLDYTQSSLTARDWDKEMSSALQQENKELKSKVLLLNNILSKFRNKDAKNYTIVEEQRKLAHELKSKNEVLQSVNE